MNNFFRWLIFINLVLAFPLSFFNFQNNHLILITSTSENYQASTFQTQNDVSFLVLGVPGEGYEGSYNTDSILIFHFEKGKLFLVSIPRDLLIKDNDDYFKINSLFVEGKIDFLLKEIEKMTGWSLIGYLLIDLHLVKKIVNFIGGVEVAIDQPVIDAASLFTLKPGKYFLDGDWAEFILRSRYAPTGDFFRIRNQHKLLISIFQKIRSLNKKELINLINKILNEKKHWQTNISLLKFYKLWVNWRDLNLKSIKSIVLDLKSGLLEEGYFQTNVGYVYGLKFKDEVDYDIIRTWFEKQTKYDF